MSSPSGPLRESPTRVPASAPLSHREGDFPIARALSDQPVDSQRSGDAEKSGRWGLVEAQSVSFPEESSASLLRHLFSVGEKKLGD